MSKSILTESTKSKFKVLEHKPANVLKRIQGVLSDFKSNRNGRKYPRELWQNVLNSDYVKEMIESHGLVGELDHPETRLEISLQNVSHVINDMWIEGDQVLGTIDILPTPSGKIVSELLDYGTDIGISSRGAGTVLADDTVDPSDYQFVTFDFVARPSCEAARLNMIVEGVQTEIDNNSDDKVKSIIEGYKTGLREDTSDAKSIVKSMLEKDGEVLVNRGMRKVVVTQINEENFNDMPDMLIKQLKKEHKLNYWIDILVPTRENKPYSYEHLPIFGDDTKYVTKWFSSTKEKAIKRLLNDKELNVVDQAVIDKSYRKQVKNIQKSLSEDDYYSLSYALSIFWSYGIDPETCSLSKLKQTVKQASRVHKEHGLDGEFNVDKIYNAIIQLYNRSTNEGYKTGLKENNSHEQFSDKDITRIKRTLNKSKELILDYLNNHENVSKKYKSTVRVEGPYTSIIDEQMISLMCNFMIKYGTHASDPYDTGIYINSRNPYLIEADNEDIKINDDIEESAKIVTDAFINVKFRNCLEDVFDDDSCSTGLGIIKGITKDNRIELKENLNEAIEEIDMDKEDAEFDKAIAEFCKALNAKYDGSAYREHGWYSDRVTYSKDKTGTFWYHASTGDCDASVNGKPVCKQGEYCESIEELVAKVKRRLNRTMKESISLKENDFETYTDYSGDKPVKKQRHTNDYCTVAAAEFTVDRLPANWRELPDDELEDLVREEVNTYNYANVEPEYEKEDFYGDEANAKEVYQYILDNKKSKETRVNESDESNEYFIKQTNRLYDDILTLAKEAEQAQHKELSKKLDNILDILDTVTNESIEEYQKRIMNSLVESLINKSN